MSQVKDDLGIMDAFGLSDDSDDSSEEKKSPVKESKHSMNLEELPMAPRQVEFQSIRPPEK